MTEKSPVDVLFLIRARLDSGRSKGAPQLNKDIRVLKKAAKEIEQLRAAVERLQRIIDSRPAINAGLPQTYIDWSRGIYEIDAIQPTPEAPCKFN